MRHTEFWARMEQALGPGVRPVVGRAARAARLDGRTVLESLEAGEPPKTVWRAVWAELGLPARER